MRPTIGRIVIYASKMGDGIKSPAVITRTRDTTVTEVAERWGPEPEPRESVVDDSVHMTAARPDSFVVDLASDEHVDLAVFGLGKTYREFNVPFDGFESHNGQAPGTWAWPARV